MKILQRSIVVIALLSLVSGCYMGISGRVIDAESQQPIEGAVVLVEWTKTHGFGEYWTESYKVVETVSDKQGNVKIAGCYSPFVNAPDVTVYKKGYVAWNDKHVFPKNDKRTDFEWRSGAVLKLEKFLSAYSYINHETFIDGAAHLWLSTEKKTIFRNYYRESEIPKVIEEQKKRDKSKEPTK